RASALDLARLMNALAKGRLLPREQIEAMWEPTRLADGTTVPYGLGTRLGALDGHRKVGHTGGIDAYQGVLAHYPDDGLTVTVLINTEFAGGAAVDALSIEAEVARAALGLPEMDVR